MQVKEININTGKIKRYGICQKKYKISFLGGPTTPTYSKKTTKLNKNPSLKKNKKYKYSNKQTTMTREKYN